MLNPLKLQTLKCAAASDRRNRAAERPYLLHPSGPSIALFVPAQLNSGQNRRHRAVNSRLPKLGAWQNLRYRSENRAHLNVRGRLPAGRRTLPDEASPKTTEPTSKGVSTRRARTECRGSSGGHISASANGARSARVTVRTAMPGTISPMIRRNRVLTIGKRTVLRVSATLDRVRNLNRWVTCGNFVIDSLVLVETNIASL